MKNWYPNSSSPAFACFQTEMMLNETRDRYEDINTRFIKQELWAQPCKVHANFGWRRRIGTDAVYRQYCPLSVVTSSEEPLIKQLGSMSRYFSEVRATFESCVQLSDIMYYK